MKIPVETSARHLHVSREDLDTLFGKGFELTKKKDLSQPDQFASGEKVTLVGPRGEFKMTILGPCRKSTQVEVSLSDARSLGIAPPVRESGDTAGSAAGKLVGPAGEVMLKEGVIIAKRHIHASPQEAERLGIKNGEAVSVKVESGDRSLIFGDVVVRVSPAYTLTMHIDTDESNAAGASGEVFGTIIR
ncbi:MAG: phosphate propanoyltransferase [Clostridiales bacterium]|jgi:putative phosphotransacetylase|nr:phosphate propanoyltransferase [Clostridiales bacterium]